MTARGGGRPGAGRAEGRAQAPRDSRGLTGCLGLACYLSWGYLAFHSPSLVWTGAPNEELNACYLASVAAAALAMALAVPLRRRLLPLLRQRRFMGTAAAMWAASTAAMGLFMRAPAALVAAVASGLSSALFPLAWGLFLGLSRPSVARRTVAGAKELFLSASTVKTHVGHVYEKTGAHSKQELMDVVRGSPSAIDAMKIHGAHGLEPGRARPSPPMSDARPAFAD